MLRQLDQNLWVAEQPFNYFGIEVGTRMTVVRLSNGSLAVFSPIAVDADLQRQIDDIGPVEHMIAPNLYHYLYVSDFKARYPSAVFWAAPGLQEKKPDLPIDRVIAPDDSSLWADLEGLYFEGLTELGLGGFDALHEWVFFHAASRTLITTDAAFYFDDGFPFVTKLMAKVTGDYQSLAPTVFGRLGTRNKQPVKAVLDKVLQWDFERVVMTHGSVVEKGGKRKLVEGYRKFLR